LWEKNNLALLDEEMTDINVDWPTLKKQVNNLVAAGVDVLILSNGVEPKEIKALRAALAPFLNPEE
jgi:hypothetical protein